jgi:Undecaprenyl-phosphate glucose phosphotransferase
MVVPVGENINQFSLGATSRFVEGDVRELQAGLKGDQEGAMRSDTEAAPQTAKSFAAASLWTSIRNWRLPIAYRAIPIVALALDLALIAACAFGAEAIFYGVPEEFDAEFSHSMAAAMFVAVLFVAAMRVQKLYDPTRLIVMDDQARSVLSAWSGVFLILASGVFSWGVSKELSRGDILLFWALGALALLAHRVFWRFALPRALESGALRGRTVVSLTSEETIPQGSIDNLTRHGYHIAAHFNVPSADPDADGIVDRIIDLCRTSEIEEIVLFVDPERMSHLRSIARRLRILPLPVTLVPVGALSQLFQRAHNDIGDTVAIELQRAALSPVEQILKRTVDIVVSVSALALLSPLMAAVAIAIKLDSAGPILFRQTRHGFNGRPFGIYKFRSMTVMENGEVVRQAQKNDTRVTRVGYWIRRFSIDELPQLFNVAIGDMSIVGPRPHASAHDRFFASAIEKYAFRHHVKSGITGWAQVCGARGETDTLEKMQRRVDLDLWYINNWSIWLDFSIMIRTIFVVLARENAH